MSTPSKTFYELSAPFKGKTVNFSDFKGKVSSSASPHSSFASPSLDGLTPYLLWTLVRPSSSSTSLQTVGSRRSTLLSRSCTRSTLSEDSSCLGSPGELGSSSVLCLSPLPDPQTSM